MLTRLMNEVLIRNYRCVINEIWEKTGIRQSFGSKAFKQASTKALDWINKMDLSDIPRPTSSSLLLVLLKAK